MNRDARRQIRAAAVILRKIQICRIARDTYVCLGCGAKDQQDCSPGCWASAVEQSAAMLAELIGLRHG